MRLRRAVCATLLLLTTACGASSKAPGTGVGRGPEEHRPSTGGHGGAPEPSQPDDDGPPAADGAVADGVGPVTTDATNAERADASGEVGGAVQDATTDVDPAKPAPCASNAPPFCDDGNACTADRITADCRCVHEALGEGARCDDGDSCTAGDQCIAGACRGKARTTVSSLKGTLRSYGGPPALDTVVAFPATDRAVFLSGNLLTLTAVSGDQLEVLDRTLWGGTVTSSNISPTIWVRTPDTFIVPLSPTRIAVIGARWGVDLFDIAGNAFKRSYRIGFGAGASRAVMGATGRGPLLWTCYADAITGYRVDDGGRALLQGKSVSLPGGAPCFDLALSDDGNTLYAATKNGIAVLEVGRPTGDLTYVKTLLEGRFLLQVKAHGSYLATYELKDVTSGVGSVRVVNAVDGAAVSTFGESASDPAPLGVAFVDSGWVVPVMAAGACAPLEAKTHGFAAAHAGASWAGFSVCEPHFVLSRPLPLASSGALLALPPQNQVVRIDPTTLALSPIAGREQGGFMRVRTVDASTIEAHGLTSQHRIDISHPETPVVSSGGLLSPVRSEWLRVEIDGEGKATLLTLPDWVDARPSGARGSVYWTKPGDALPTVQGSFVPDDPRGLWSSAAGAVYQLATVGPRAFRLRRFPGAAWGRGEDQAPRADLDVTLTPASPSALGNRVDFLYRVDPVAGEVAIVETRKGADGVQQSVVSRYAGGSGGWRELYTVAQPWDTVVDVGLSAGKTLLVSSASKIVVFDSTGSVQTVSNAGVAQWTGLLSIDANEVWLSGILAAAPAPATPGVVVLRARDLAEVTRYTTVEPVRSMTRAGGSVALGMATALTVVEPACRGDRGD